MRLWFFVLFLLPLLGQAYVMWHSWVTLPTVLWLRLAVVLLELLAFGVFVMAFTPVKNHLSLPWATFVYEVGTSWIFILLYLFIVFLFLDVARWVHVMPKQWLCNNMWMGLGIFLFVTAIFVYGNLHYHQKERVELTYRSDKITKPLKVVMISDVHLGYHNTRRDLHQWIATINGEHPDLVLIAGDIVDGSILPVEEEKSYEEFHVLKAPVYACVGNHDYMTGIGPDLKFCEQAGIQILKDEVAYWGDLALVGRDDRTNPHRKTLAQITDSIDRHKFIVELDHQPYHLEEAEACGVDLELAGHTHNGQIWPISWLVQRMYECAYGAWTRGNTEYYISSGIGIWGGKFRIGTQSEYVVIELQPK